MRVPMGSENCAAAISKSAWDVFSRPCSYRGRFIFFLLDLARIFIQSRAMNTQLSRVCKGLLRTVLGFLTLALGLVQCDSEPLIVLDIKAEF